MAERKHILNRDETGTKNHLTRLLEAMEEEYVVIIAMGIVGAKRQLRASHTNTVFLPSDKPTLCHPVQERPTQHPSTCYTHARQVSGVKYSHCTKYVFNQMTHCILQRIGGEQSFSMVNSL